MRRYIPLVLPIVLVTLADCVSSTGLGRSSLPGVWRTGSPTTSMIELSLRSGVLKGIDGKGAQYISSGFFDSLDVTGHWNADGSFHLSLAFRQSTSATYDGTLVSADQLDGTMIRNGQAAPDVAFYRHTQ